MAIKVFIERKIQPGRELDVYNSLIKLRARAMRSYGYVSGETLVSYNNPQKYLVISTWNSLEAWQKWAESEERKAIEREIEPYLEAPPKVEIYLYEARPT